jgi:Zn-dependent peptidase ImmA (M78 family)
MAIEQQIISSTHRELIRRFQESVPVRLASLAKELGLRVISSTLPTGISGEIRPANGTFVISVNRHDSERRQRFTVAHEISHYLLHREQIGSGITDDVLYRSSLSDSREAEANRLAAQILMPREKVQELAAACAGMPEEEKINFLASAFEVSEVAMKIRLGIA